jgi:hypothetical protein
LRKPLGFARFWGKTQLRTIPTILRIAQDARRRSG